MTSVEPVCSSDFERPEALKNGGPGQGDFRHRRRERRAKRDEIEPSDPARTTSRRAVLSSKCPESFRGLTPESSLAQAR
jgi:hypothetical protein